MVQPHNHPNYDSPFLLPSRGDLIWKVKLVPVRAAEPARTWAVLMVLVVLSTLILISLDAVTSLGLFPLHPSPLAS